MNRINELQGSLARSDSQVARNTLTSICGTLQRVNYYRRELSVVAVGRIWQFTVGPDSHLWFNDAPTILRCFHPLDVVQIVFDPESNNVWGLYCWDRGTS